MEKLDKNPNTGDQLVKKFDSKNDKKPWGKILVICLVVGLLGLGSGLLIAKGTTGGTTSSDEVKTASDIEKGKTYGVDDTATFSDEAEGLLKEGGIEGEGQYHLERPGGETQYVYLTSSVVDLGLLKGRKIKVWGQTQKAQTAPWLMDVGKVEVLN
jgi:hypothetical protein